MQELIKREAIDQERMYVSGISAGGTVTAELINRYPKLFAAGVIMSSYWDFTKRQVEQLQELPLWITAGSADKILPEAYIRLMILRLQAYGAKVNYEVFPELGHFSWIPLYSNPDFLPWLFRQQGKVER